MNMDEAQSFLGQHLNYEARPIRADPMDPGHMPTLDRIEQLVQLLGDPHKSYPVIHITGTNGKSSVARIVTALMISKGLKVGTFISPHLEHLNERISVNGEPISDGELEEAFGAIALVEPDVNERLTVFEILTASAYRYFADEAVDVAVIEVGMGGEWDATNVVEADVAVVTTIGLDHAEFLGNERESVAATKAGIIKPNSIVVSGETEPNLIEIFAERRSRGVLVRDRDFGCISNEIAHGGRMLSIRTPYGIHDDVYLALHGSHQGDNAAVAVTAVEAFFDSALESVLVHEALGIVRSPGRMEIMSRRPLLIIDGAHNVEGAEAAAATIADEFSSVSRRTLVIGLLAGRDPGEILKAFVNVGFERVIACTPPNYRALQAGEVAAAGAALGVETASCDEVGDAIALAVSEAAAEDLVLITGSLYVVGAARSLVHRP